MSSQICNSTSGLWALVTDPPQVIVTKYLIIWCQGIAWSLHPTTLQEIQETRAHSWVKRIPWRREWQPTPGFLPGKSHQQRSLAGYSPWGCKESDKTELLRFHLKHLFLCVSVTYTVTNNIASGKEPACHAGDLKRCGFNPWVRKIPWSRAWQPTPESQEPIGFLLGESHEQRSLEC